MLSFHVPHRRAALVGLALVALSSPALAAPSYHLVDLGPDTQANHINNVGEITGSAATGPGYLHNGIWHSTTAIGAIAALDDLGDLVENTWTLQVVYAPHGDDAVTLPPIPGAIWTTGSGVSSGRVAGETMGQDFIPSCFVWTPESGYQMLTPAGSICAANAMNASGQVTGWHLNDVGATVAYVWQGGVFQDIPPLPGSEAGASEVEEGAGINRHGHVIFSARMRDGSYHAALFAGGRVFDAGPCAAGGPFGINDVDQLLSTDVEGNGWFWSQGVSTPLSQMVDVGSEWTNLQGSSINAAGVIVGNGMLAGVPHAFVLQPLAAD